jgi:uncharacterized membrane protein YesL
MRELFNPDGRLYQWVLKVYEILVLHALFLVTAIPLVTIGASTTALYASWFKIWNGTHDGKLARTFFTEFRDGFAKSTIVWLVMLVCGAACIWLLYPFAVAPAVRAFPPLSFAVILIVAIIALSCGYVFPVLARFENTAWKAVSNAFLIAMANMGVSVVVFLVNGGVLVAGFIISGRLVILWLFGSFGIASFCNSWILNKVLGKYAPADTPAGP